MASFKKAKRHENASLRKNEVHSYYFKKSFRLREIPRRTKRLQLREGSFAIFHFRESRRLENKLTLPFLPTS